MFKRTNQPILGWTSGRLRREREREKKQTPALTCSHCIALYRTTDVCLRPGPVSHRRKRIRLTLSESGAITIARGCCNECVIPLTVRVGVVTLYRFGSGGGIFRALTPFATRLDLFLFLH